MHMLSTFKKGTPVGRSLFLWLGVGLLGLAGCQAPTPGPVTFQGQTMGTTYTVTYAAGPDAESLQPDVDALLVDVNQSLSTYIDTALISRINAATDTSARHPVDAHFKAVFLSAKTIHADTDGAFNPALGPLIEAWGFGTQAASVLDSATVDSLRALSDFAAFVLIGDTLQKRVPNARLDFSAIAKGYGVDEVGRLLETRGVQAYFVEIGGEVRTRGRHPEDRPWQVAIERPTPDARAIQTVLALEDAGLATSGNYRNFYERDGVKYVHTINPYTGYARAGTLLSASVIAADCMTADAYATAFMVMGFEATRAFLEGRTDLEVYLIGGDPGGEYMTPGYAARVQS